MGFLHGKRALIVGIASQRSIAWGIANAMHREGAQLAFTYQNERLRDRVDEAASAFGSNIVLPCDVSSDAEIDTLFSELGKHWDGFDILVHSVGFAPREALQREIKKHLGVGADTLNLLEQEEGFQVLAGEREDEGDLDKAADTLISVETLHGTQHDDTLTGNEVDNRLYGRDGHDTLAGAGGNDRLHGGIGNDALFGGAGIDTLLGEGSDDTFTLPLCRLSGAFTCNSGVFASVAMVVENAA